VLEFGQPGGAWFGPLYRFYSHSVLPRLGGFITGQPSAYEYLDRTSSRFPSGERFLAMMRDTSGYRDVHAHALTGGVAYVYIGEVA